MRHALSARDVVADASARLGLDPAVVTEIFEEAPLDFPVYFSPRLPLFAHRFGMIGITIGARVWLLETARTLSGVALITLVRHEAEHVLQQRERPVLFYARYALEYLRGLLPAAHGSAVSDEATTQRAYRAIGYERAAYAAGERARRRIVSALGGDAG